MVETDKVLFEMHAWNENHRVRLDEASILTTEDHLVKRKLNETAHKAVILNAISTASINRGNIWLLTVRDNLK